MTAPPRRDPARCEVAMPRHAQVDSFADKLKLALGRANLSRAALAQRLGKDKSVVARWAAGTLHPADQSLAALSAALGRVIPGFDRTAWDLAPTDFAARLGLPAAGGRDAMVATPPLAQLAAALATESLAQAEAAHAGIWLMLYPSISRPGQLHGYAARLRALPDLPALSAEFSNGGTVHGQGFAFPYHYHLHMQFQGRMQDATLGHQILNRPHEDRAEILDGLMTVLGAGMERALGAGRCIWLRLTDSTDDADFAAAMPVAEARTGDWETVLTPALREAFRLATGEGAAVLRQARIAPGENWAIGRRSLRRPEAAHHREAIAAARGLFRGCLQNLAD
jgi:transcriptional regulator with XRE-family HTH domain